MKSYTFDTLPARLLGRAVCENRILKTEMTASGFIFTADLQGEALLDLELDEAADILVNMGLDYRTIGQGDTVTGQLPVAGESIAKGSRVILYLGGAQVSPNMETVPNLAGLSYESARDLLSGLGLFISTRSPVSGSAQQVVGSQSLAAGTRADHGCVVEVTLIDENESLLGKY